MAILHNDISLVLGGAAGRGVQTVEDLLLIVLRRAGYHAFASKEYMSRVRGGSNSSEIRISSKRMHGAVHRADLVFLFDGDAYEHLRKRIGEETFIFADESVGANILDHRVISVPFSLIAKELGSPLFANMVAAGVIFGLLGIETDGIGEILEKKFSSKEVKVVEGNREAIERGRKFGEHLAYTENFAASLSRGEGIREEVSVSGTDAIAVGAILGGCDFVASYPMSPATGVLQFLAREAHRFGMAVEQVEDEIAAINMGIGASYAGARAFVTTSGGGFALMEEGVSLAGMMETPIVIHIAQRPGPATGLPTRTEQGDLNLALFSGHGEFPRAIFAPGTHEEAVALTKYAFDIAEKWQSPVFVLTDQYLLDTVTTVPKSVFEMDSEVRTVIETKKDYCRYAYTENGVSPRGVPGYGDGFVVADSDEHTEDGHLTERLDTRVRMMDKRMKKLEGIAGEALLPTRTGSKKAEILLVGWGSTYGALAEAVARLNREEVAALHFSQVFPLPNDTKGLFRGAKRIIVFENNYAGQFADLLVNQGIKVTERVTKYNGEPFDAEEILSKFKI